MSVIIEILSGLGAKGPAAIVVEAQGKRLLLDAGGALHPDDTITWANNLNVDAVLISHDHIDHIGGVAELAENVPLYCTPLVAKALPHNRSWLPLPERGTLEVEGITVTTGQAGHSLGGVWLHLAVEGGVFYSGDACFESRLFPFDTPPTARIALLDASYGSYDQPQVRCVQAISEFLYQPLAFPVPETGRALEMALWLAEEADRRQLTLAIDPVIRDNLAALLALPATLRRPGLDHSIHLLLARQNVYSPNLQLVCDRNDTPEQWPDHHLLHTGYLTPDRRAELAAGEISWQRWNVHLRASHLVALADQLDATQVVPLFTQFSDNELNAWHRLLSDRLCTAQRFSANSRLVTLSCLGSFACPQ
ncbi:MBL fold metallo-hydrolase [Vreelandella boliviensis]|uniref:Hydroxyacylglutathione hydrolase n=1 Tax=Vreelandella boliviensis LC1 TaxID=1072583 RepID=A0A265E1E3_9GAMM|nr:MBL fold metallo-hydrolase [Halomonas boliviensis]EHJ94818.1 Hydroxyacylglutathione hydrolase [Halomonas boliviensis LC1]OZT75350.1 MBL fold metallo-hydrolase [Halomonas boliviensis LC1]